MLAQLAYSTSVPPEKRKLKNLMLAVLNRTKDVTLDAARLKVFMEKIKKHEVVKPESLPPTSDQRHSILSEHILKYKNG